MIPDTYVNTCNYKLSTTFHESFESELSWLDYCDKNYQQLLKEELPCVKSDKSKQEPQPVWNMSSPPLGDKEKVKKEEPEEPKNGDFDYLAWYKPLHYSSLDDYGIYLPLSGIVHLAEKLKIKIANNTSFTNRQLIYLSAQILYLHELCHAYIERLVYAMEVFCENDHRYTETYDKYWIILMEEALCNTFITAQLKDFLESHAKGEMQPLRDKFKIVHDALLCFIKGQSKGYKDFIDLNGDPDQEKKFSENCQVLLFHLYDINIDLQHLGFKIIHPFTDPCDFESLQYQKAIFSDKHVPWNVPCHFVAHMEQEFIGRTNKVLDIREAAKPGYLEFVIGKKRYYYLTDKISIKELPSEINGTLICNDIDLDSLEPFVNAKIDGDFYCKNNNLNNLTNIGKKILLLVA